MTLSGIHCAHRRAPCSKHHFPSIPAFEVHNIPGPKAEAVLDSALQCSPTSSCAEGKAQLYSFLMPMALHFALLHVAGSRVGTLALPYCRFDQYSDAWDTSIVINIDGQEVRFFHCVDKYGVDRVWVDHPAFLSKVRRGTISC